MARQPPAVRDAWLQGLSDQDVVDRYYQWHLRARPEQLPPPGDWTYWLILAGRGWGKALHTESMLPTPSGWTTIAAVQVGDLLFDEQGAPCHVTSITPIMHGRPCYDVVFDDGTVVLADAEHRWLTKDKAARKAEGPGRRIARPSRRPTSPQCQPRAFARVVTTQEIRATVRRSAGEVNHSVDVASPLQCPAADLPVDPYVLGVWLGDGDAACAVITTADAEVLDGIRAAGVTVGEAFGENCGAARRYALGVKPPRRDPVTGRMLANDSLHSALRALGVLRNKHIPLTYQRASIAQRTELLKGLMDTDGSVEPGGNCEYNGTNPRLVRDAWLLTLGLGFKATLGTGRATLGGRDCGAKYRVSFTPHRPVFHVGYKLARQHSGKTQRERTHRRYIVAVRPRASVPVRCLTVDSPSHLFLVGEECVPTHNTRTGAEWVRAHVQDYGRWLLVGRTAADVRDIMIEGESGLLNIGRPEERPLYEPSKRQLTWPNGAIGILRESGEPEGLRGQQFAAFWADELAAWTYPDECWAQLTFGFRSGRQPRGVITTTPKPIPLVKQLLADPACVATRGSTYDNVANLATAFIRTIIRRYEGTRLGRQELLAELLEDAPGALWTRAMIERGRVLRVPPLVRIVVGVDPGGATEEGAAETGIIVAGISQPSVLPDGSRREQAYVLEDCSLQAPPGEWGAAAVAAYHKWRADRIVGEVNFGGDMVGHVITTIDRSVAFKPVRASRNKKLRAEPVAALYEQGLAHMVGSMPVLEDQLTSWVPGLASPDRMDALVWAISDLVPQGGGVDPAELYYLRACPDCGAVVSTPPWLAEVRCQQCAWTGGRTQTKPYQPIPGSYPEFGLSDASLILPPSPPPAPAEPDPGGVDPAELYYLRLCPECANTVSAAPHLGPIVSCGTCGWHGSKSATKAYTKADDYPSFSPTD